MAINFDKLVENILQRPLVNNMPLYLRVDGTCDISGNNKTSEDWNKITKVRCTSPDNLKRLFITTRGVVRHLHLPIDNKGKKVYGNEYDDKYQELIDRALAGDRSIQIRGCGLASLKRAHVYQNVEEIYIDNMMIIGQNRKGIRVSNMQSFIELLFCEMMNDTGALSINDEAYINRYPRLRNFVYVESLGNLLFSSDSKVNYNIFNVNADVDWIEAAKQVVDVGKFIKANMQMDIDRSRLSWSVKPGIYVFDRDKLEPFIEKDKERITALLQSKRRETLENEEKNETEAFLDKLAFDEANIRIVLITLGKLKLLKLSDINSFSELGRRKYGNIFMSLTKA